jgi:hypothetical protein
MKRIGWVFVGLSLWASVQVCAGGGVFWTDRQTGARGVRRVGFDGSGPTLVTGLQGRGNPRGIEVDRVRGMLYFVDATLLLSVAYDYNTQTAGAITTLASGTTLRDITLDRANRYLYYADENVNAWNRVALPGAVPDGGSFPKSVPSAYYGHAVTVNDTVTGLPVVRFFVGSSGATMWYLSTVGPTQMTADAVDFSTAGSAFGPELRGVQIDPVEGYVYWCEKDAFRIRRARWDGVSKSLAAPQDLYTGLNAPHGLSLDVARRRIYWVDSGTNAVVGIGAGGVTRGDMNGATPAEPLVASGAGSGQPWDLALDLTTATYGEWVALYFRKDVTAADKVQLADPDVDGLSNLVECMLGTDPRFADATPVESGQWLDPAANPLGGDTYPTITYLRRSGVAGLTLSPEVSTRLDSWESNAQTPASPVTAELSVTPLADGLERVRVRSLRPLRLFPRQFLRVKATATP